MWTFLEELENASCWKGKLANTTWENWQMIQFHLGHIPLWIITQDMSWTSSELTNGVGILALVGILLYYRGDVYAVIIIVHTFTRQGNLWLFQLLSVEAINEGTWIHDAPKPIQTYLGLIASSRWLLLPPVANESKWHQLFFFRCLIIFIRTCWNLL